MKNFKTLSFLLVSLVAFSLSCVVMDGLGQSATPVSSPTQEPNRSSLVFKPEKLPDAQREFPYEVKVTVENAQTPVFQLFMAKGPFPSGLALKKIEGENAALISGIPQEPGTYKFTLEAWCYGTNRPGQTGQVEYTITVKQ